MLKGQGKKEDILTVSDGYARNYLFPRKWAMEASPAAVKEIQRKRAAEEQQEKERREEAAALAKTLEGKELRLTAKCGETGRLYGSVTNQEIADALKHQLGFETDKRKIDCEPIRQTRRVFVHRQCIFGHFGQNEGARDRRFPGVSSESHRRKEAAQLESQDLMRITPPNSTDAERSVLGAAMQDVGAATLAGRNAAGRRFLSVGA